MDTKDPVIARLIDRVAQARERRTPLKICGGGTKDFYGESPQGEPLHIAELAGITSYEPTELVVTARAGTQLEELETTLAQQGQCLPFEPPRFAAGGTLGGMVAAGLSGPSRSSVGSVRDHVLGLTLLNGRGEILTFGGQVSKNVAGYDVSRLMAGSLGILGVICEVSLKVLPISVGSATLLFECDETAALEQLSLWASKPLPINASAWHEGRLYVRLAGAQAAVNEACKTLGGQRLLSEVAQAWWTAVRDQSAEFFSLNDVSGATAEALWRVSVPATSPALALVGRQFIEWGGAQRWCRTTATAEQVRAAAARAGGHATLIRGADRSVGVFTPLTAALMGIHQGLKQAFDPVRIFNPGRLYPDL
jgi:glycolate oxidase FAD binding subunit